jgi:hypothetical protein
MLDSVKAAADPCAIVRRGFPMRLLLAVAALAALALPALAVSARAELFECRFEGENSWVPATVVVEAGAQGSEVAVFDPIIRHFRNAPVKARVEADNRARTTFTWSLKVANGVNQHATMRYRMTRLKADSAATIHAQPVGFAGPYSGFGRCRTLPGKL